MNKEYTSNQNISTFSQAAREYYEQELPVIPVFGKAPVIKSWTRYSSSLPTSDDFDSWECKYANHGIGLVLGHASATMAVDIDSDELLQPIIQMLPRTPYVKRGKKGATLFYPFNPLLRSQSMDVGGHHVGDILCVGKQTVLPPSIHPDTGKPYVWENEPLNREKIDELLLIQQVDVDAIKSFAEITYSEPIKNGNFVTTGRNNTLLGQVVAALYKNKTDDSICVEIVKFDKEMHNPPLFSDQSESQMRGNSPSENAKSFVESVRKSLQIEATKPAIKKLYPTGFNLIRIGDLINSPDEELKYLVEGLLLPGCTSLYTGKPKTGKTTTIRNLALSVARGEKFLGKYKTEKNLVVFLALEESKQQLKNIYKKLGANSKDNILLHVSSAPNNAIEEFIDIVRRLKPGLVIIDTLFRLLRVEELNDYGKVNAAMEPINALAHETGAHIMGVHHESKSNSGGGDSVLGSTAILGSVDTSISQRIKNGRRVLSTIQRYGEQLDGIVLELDGSTGQVFVAGDLVELKKREMEDKILDSLKAATEAVDENWVDEQVQGQATIKKRALRDLVQSGKVVRTGGGKKNDPFYYSDAK